MFKKNAWLAELVILIILTIIFIGGGVMMHPAGGNFDDENIAREKIIPRIEYGILVDSLEVVRGIVKRVVIRGVTAYQNGKIMVKPGFGKDIRRK